MCTYISEWFWNCSIWEGEPWEKLEVLINLETGALSSCVFKWVVLKLESASELSIWLVKTSCWVLPPVGLGQGPRICISQKCPGDTKLEVHRWHLAQHLTLKLLYVCFICSPRYETHPMLVMSLYLLKWGLSQHLVTSCKLDRGRGRDLTPPCICSFWYIGSVCWREERNMLLALNNILVYIFPVNKYSSPTLFGWLHSFPLYGCKRGNGLS